MSFSKPIDNKIKDWRTPLHFGKHAGKTLNEIWREDFRYLSWLLENDHLDLDAPDIDFINTRCGRFEYQEYGWGDHPDFNR